MKCDFFLYPKQSLSEDILHEKYGLVPDWFRWGVFGLCQGYAHNSWFHHIGWPQWFYQSFRDSRQTHTALRWAKRSKAIHSFQNSTSHYFIFFCCGMSWARVTKSKVIVISLSFISSFLEMYVLCWQKWERGLLWSFRSFFHKKNVLPLLTESALYARSRIGPDDGATCTFLGSRVASCKAKKYA